MMVVMKYNRVNKIRELEDEIAMNMKGTTCAPRHVKVRCRQIIQENYWKISRLKKNKSIDNVPSTVYFSKMK